jgi:hypothetical protein
MSRVTTESVERMAAAAIANVLSVFDKRIVEANVVNKQVLAK